MRCPVCQSSVLQVEFVFSGNVTCSFQSDDEFELAERISLRSDWTDESPCRCQKCGWEGVLGAARRSPRIGRKGAVKGAVKSPAHSEQSAQQEPQAGTIVATQIGSMAEVKKLLASRECDPVWRACLSFLMVEVERLNNLVESIRHLYRTAQRDEASEDTTLL